MGFICIRLLSPLRGVGNQHGLSVDDDEEEGGEDEEEAVEEDEHDWIQEIHITDVKGQPDRRPKHVSRPVTKAPAKGKRERTDEPTDNDSYSF